MRLDVPWTWWDGAQWIAPDGTPWGPPSSAGQWQGPVRVDDDTAERARGYLALSGNCPVAVQAQPTVLFVNRWRELVVYVSQSGELPKPPSGDVQRDHPRGMKGVRDAAELVAEAIVRGMRNRWMVIWTRNRLTEARPPPPRGRLSADWAAAVLFEAVKKRVAFVPDPVDTEFMAPPEQILCIDPEAACLLAGDCDEQLIALGSALEACGIDVRLLVRRYPGMRQAHIMVEYLNDAGDWTCLDPSLDSGVCSSAPYSEEFRIVPRSYDDDKGVFIGLGGSGSLGAAATTQTLPADQAAGWLSLLASTKASIDQAVTYLTTMSAAYAQVRADLGMAQFDTASSAESTATQSPIAAYVSTHLWTSAAAAQEQKIVATAQFVSQCLADAQSGKRALYFDSGDLYVESLPGDPYGLLMVADASGNPVPTYVNLSTKASMGTLGIAPIVIGLVVVAVVALSSAIATWKFCDYLGTAHHDDAMSAIAKGQQQLVASGAATPEQSTQMTKALADLAEASAPAPPKGLLSKFLSDNPVVSVGLCVALGGLAGFFLSRAFQPPALARAA